MKKIRCLWVLCLLLIPALGVSAQEQTPVQTGKVIVTATGSAATLDKIGGNSASVITSADIAAKKQMMLPQVLKGVPGVDVVTNGGPGTQSSVFIRGADSKNTLVLVDGIMLNDPSSPNRSANLGNLNVDNIERIEVVRGAMSVLYGSNATAGVINIITKKGSGTPSVFAGVEGGSYGTLKGYAGGSGAYRNFNFSASFSGTTVEGYSIANDNNDRILHDGNTSEKDSWKNLTVSGKFGYDFTPDFDINGVVRYIDSQTDLDDYYSTGGFAVDQVDYDPMTWTETPNPLGLKQQRVDTSQTLYKIDVHNRFFDQIVDSRLSYGGSNLDRTGYNAAGDEYWDYSGKTHKVGWQGSFNYQNRNYFYVGTSYWKEEMDSDSSDISENAYIYSLWGQDQLFIGDMLDIVGGVRYDKHEEFGDAVTYRIAPSFTIPQTGTVLKGSYGTGFRAPSLFELYSPYGNPDLSEEKSRGWDAGFEQPLWGDRVRFGATYFYMKYEDRIDYDFATWHYSQLPGDTTTKGVEVFVNLTPVENLELNLNFTYTDTEDPNGDELIRRPKNKVFFNGRYYFLEKGMVNLDVLWADERYASPSSRDVYGNAVEKLDSYIVVNLSASWDVLPWLQAYGRVDNLFDEDYEEAWSYATPGISGIVGLKAKY